MAEEGVMRFDAVSVLEDVKNGNRLCDVDLASRKAEEASLRRYEACGWLRKMVEEVGGGRDLPAQPSEEEFGLALRSGIVLCNVLNKVHPGSVLKVVEPPSNHIIIPDGAALSAYQYFENIRNFLDSIGHMKIPAFEASDLEQGGNSSKVVNCVLALKSYYEWKQQGDGKGVWKFSGNMKPPTSGKQFFRRNSDLFVSSLSKYEKCPDPESNARNVNETTDGSSNALHTRVCELLRDKQREDIPLIVENMLSKVMQEFDRRLAAQNAESRLSSEAKDCNIDGESEDNITLDRTNDSRSRRLDNGSHNESNMKNLAIFIKSQQSVVHELKTALHSMKEEMQMLVTRHRDDVECFGKHMNSLAHAASGYNKVVEENRKLYNQVQDLKGNIRVYCRIRPLSGQSMSLSTVEVVDEQTITIRASAKYGKGKRSFTFNRVFSPSTSQEEVFTDMQPLIRSVLDGYNVCIFAYGQTGSGKTYTMSGPGELSEERKGVNYRALRDLFRLSELRRERMAYNTSVQMIEIYNEQVRDLLATDGLNKRLEIRNGSSINSVNVPDANMVSVSSTSEVMNLMNLGIRNRAVGSTAMNDRSSRSHSCVTVHVQGRDLTTGSVLRGCMHLVDLAGSERADKSEAIGERLKEAQHINRSLSALGDVIASLAQKNSHVPYRNSKLTQLLQDSLGGQAKTLMFVHISPEADALGETLSTLKFAERVSTVELGAAKVYKETADVKQLKDEIASLKAALLRKERGDCCPRSPYVSPDRIRSSCSSPSHSSWRSTGGNFTMTEDSSSCSSTSRKQSLGGYDLSEKFAEMFYQKNGFSDASPAEESDETTSDASEIDYQSGSCFIRNGFGSKPSPPKQTKTPQMRSLIPQPPTRKMTSPLQHLNKQLSSSSSSTVEGKRKKPK